MESFRCNLGAVIVLLLVVGGFSYNYGHGQSSRGGADNPSRNPFQSRHGHEDDSVENGRDQSSYPWRHHIDFDERHPGEDQIAVETRQHETPHRRVLRRPPYNPAGRRSRVVNPYPNYHDHDSMEMETGDEGYRSPFGMQVTTLSDFFNPGAEHRRGPPINQNWMSSMFEGTPFGVHPWWKGSNVCIKREEEDENVEENSDESSEVETIIPKSGKTIRRNDSISENPEFHMKFSSCEDLDTKYACTTKLFGPSISKTIRTEYECCHGYLLNARKHTCERGRLENIAKTIEEIGGKEFIRLAKSVGLDGKLERESLTVFVPTDEAIAHFKNANTENDIESNSVLVTLERESKRRRRSILTHKTMTPRSLKRNVRRSHRSQSSLQENEQEEWTPQEVVVLDEETWKRNALDQQDEWKKQVSYSHDDNNAELQQTLLSHMVDGTISTDDFVDEKVIFSENNDSAIRMNTWQVGRENLKTVNCARLTSVNHRCSNGMVHMVDRMIKPVNKSIADVIESDPELAVLKSLTRDSGLLPMLRDKRQHLTFFAPTNQALNTMGSSLLTKMRNGDPCLKRILRHHIIPITFCTSIIYKRGQIRNIDHQLLNFERKTDDKLFINGSEIITRDIVTTNGVVHVIDAVLLSDNDKPITKALEKAGLTSFLENLSRVGLKDTLDEMTNVTVFAPNNAAMDSIPEEVKRSSEKLRELLLYHIATPETKACHFSHQQHLTTKLSNRSIMMNLYSMFPLTGDAEVTAQCGRLTKVNTGSCNGMIHTVDRVLLPADLSIIETLKTQNDFSIFSRLLEESNLQSKLKGNGPLTVFAPTDAAFYALPREDLEKILNDRKEAEKVIKKHIIEESLCCAGIAPSLWFLTKRVETLSKLHVPVFRDYKGQVVFGSSKVTTCDLTASNGIIHTIDSVLTAELEPHRNEFMGTCLPRMEDSQTTALFFTF